MIISVFDKIENIMGKGENAGYQHFILFPRCFQRLLSQTCQKVSLCGNTDFFITGQSEDSNKEAAPVQGC